MNNNKLIAEFMGIKLTENGLAWDYINNPIPSYHNSWDCLMPVISKIETVGRGWFPHELHTSLMKNDIDSAYDTVLQFINQYNNE